MEMKYIKWLITDTKLSLKWTLNIIKVTSSGLLPCWNTPNRNCSYLKKKEKNFSEKLVRSCGAVINSQAQQFDKAIEICESCADDLIEQSLEEQRVKISDLFFIALNAELLLKRINQIQQKKQLECLDLMNCMPNSQVFDRMCVTFGSSLHQVILSNSPADHLFMESLAKCSNLAAIQLDNCNALRDNDILILTQACRNLQSIDLSHTSITDIAIGYIATNIPSVKRLKLSQCDKLTDNALRYLCGCSQLEEVHLSRLKIHKETFQELIQDCSNLKKLDISYCK